MNAPNKKISVVKNLSPDAVRCRNKRSRWKEQGGSGNAVNYPWTPQEDSFITSNRGKLSRSAMARILNRSYYSVCGRLGRMKNNNVEAIEMSSEIRLKKVMADNKIGVREFAKALNIPAANLSNILNHGKFTTKDEKEGVRKKIMENLLKMGISQKDIFKPAGIHKLEPAVPEMEAEMISMEALSHFKLAEDPFERSAVKTGADLFNTPARKAAREAVNRAITRRGFLALYGEVGCGKTLLWTEIYEKLPTTTRVIKPVILEKERLTVYNLQEAIIADLKGARADYSAPLKASKEARDRQIRDLLLLYDSEKIDVVLLIEEAHTLPLRTFKALKRLWEIQAGFSAPLSIILLGQTEMKTELWSDLRIREVTRRCRLIELSGLRKAEISHYIRFKFERAHESIKKVFSDQALGAIADIYKNGAPALQINNLAVHAINQAADLNLKQVDADLIYSMIKKGG